MAEWWSVSTCTPYSTLKVDNQSLRLVLVGECYIGTRRSAGLTETMRKESPLLRRKAKRIFAERCGDRATRNIRH